MATHKEMMALAVRVAEFLLTVHGVEKIGLFGEVGFGEVGLVVYVSTDAAWQLVRQAEKEEAEYPDLYWFHTGFSVLEGILLDKSQLLELEQVMFGKSWEEYYRECLERDPWSIENPNPVPFFVLMPHPPDSYFLVAFELVQSDSNRLERATVGYQEFDPEKGVFARATPPWWKYLEEVWRDLWPDDVLHWASMETR